jgi:hypothetical protein
MRAAISRTDDPTLARSLSGSFSGSLINNCSLLSGSSADDWYGVVIIVLSLIQVELCTIAWGNKFIVRTGPAERQAGVPNRDQALISELNPDLLGPRYESHNDYRKKTFG